MDATIQFDREELLTKSFYVEDVGNCALEAVDHEGLYYYFLTRTVDGQTHTLMFGPLIPDIVELPKSYSVIYKKSDYDDEKLADAIQAWAAPKKGLKNIEELHQIKMDEALSLFIDVKDYFSNII